MMQIKMASKEIYSHLEKLYYLLDLSSSSAIKYTLHQATLDKFSEVKPN